MEIPLSFEMDVQSRPFSSHVQQIERFPSNVDVSIHQEVSRNQKERAQKVPPSSQLRSALGVLSADQIIRPNQEIEH